MDSLTLRFTPTKAVVFSGIVWLIIGLFLLMKGLSLLIFAAHPEQFGTQSAVLRHLESWAGTHGGVLLLIACGLFIGFIKGKWVLVKSVKRVVQRIGSLPLPLKVRHVYSWSYLALIGSMMLLGMGVRWLHLPADIHGCIDVAIGFALITGAMIYFRFAVALQSRV